MSEGTYTPPPPAPPSPPPPAAGPAGFDFMRPFSFIFDDPRWLPKILIGGLFYLLGFVIIGFFFILGYLARLARNVIAGVPNPLPEWDDLGEYFSEGLRLVAVAILWILPIFILAMFFVVPAAVMSESDNDVASGIGGCFLGGAWCLMFPLGLAITFFLPASLMMAVTENRFGAAFEFERIWSFIKRNIGDYLLAIVVYFIANFVAQLGVILLCVGVIFTSFWSTVITTYAFAQVFRRAQTAGRITA